METNEIQLLYDLKRALHNLIRLPQVLSTSAFHLLFPKKRRGRYYYLVLGSIFLLAGVAAITITLNTKKAEAAWYNDQWAYRQAITATIASNSSEISSLETLVNIDTESLITAGKLQSTCNDLRFTSATGKLLPYYMDSACNTGATHIWLLVDKVPANVTTYTLYMYYGNQRASSVSNPAKFNLVQGLQGYWKMNESTSLNSGIGYNGTAGEVKDSAINALHVKMNGTIGVSGTATGGSTTTLVKAAAGWAVRGFVGMTVKITSGTDNGQTATITDNDATTLTFTPAMTGSTSGSTFTIDDIATGKYGNAVGLNGTDGGGVNNYLDFSSDASAIGSGAVTFSVWWQPPVTLSSGNGDCPGPSTHWYLINLQDASSTNDIDISFTTNCKMDLTAADSGGTLHDILSTQVVWTAGVWYHIVATVSPTTGMNLYVNGSVVASNANVTTRGSTQSQSLIVSGSGSGPTTAGLSGLYDDIRVYTRAVSAAEVRQLYYSPGQIANYPYADSNPTLTFATEELSPGPIAYWKFDEGQGITAKDSGSYGYDGILTGSTLPTWQTDDQCLSGKCLYFNGVTSNVSVSTTKNITPTLVQHNYINPGSPTGHSTPVTLTYTNAQGVGDTNIVVIGWGLASGSVSSIVDSAGNSYQIAAPLMQAQTFSQVIYYAPITHASAAGANTVTVTMSADETMDVRISEFTGLTSSPFDQTHSNNGNSTALDSGNTPTTTAANELVFGAGTVGGAVTSPGAGFTTIDITSPFSDIHEYKTVTSTGTYNATATQITGQWIMQVATFKAALATPSASTISFWAKPATSSASFLQLTNAADVYASSGVVSTDGITSPTIYVNGVVNGTLNANQWNHIEVTTSTAISANNVILGKLWRGVLNGFLDEVKFYPYVRTSAQVSADFNARGTKQGGSAVLGSNASNNINALNNGLVGYWKMDESSSANSGVGYNGTSGEAVDSSGNSNNGTFNGTKGLASTTASGCAGGTCNATHVNKTAAGWTAHAFTNMSITFTSGTDNGQSAIITDNTNVTITFSPAMSGSPANGDTFTVSDMGTGKFGNGGAFNGVDDYVDVADASNLRVEAGDFTISMWVYNNNSNAFSNDTLIAKGDPGNYEYALETRSTDNKYIVWVGESGGGNTITPANGTEPQYNQWQFVTLVRKGTTASVYSNGTLAGSATVLSTQTDTKTLQIGAFNSIEFMHGKIDEVRIYNRALSPADVTALYNFAPGPIAYYNFEEGSGSTVNDTSGNGNSGTWSGTGVQHWISGKVGKSANFVAAQKDYVQVAGTTQLQNVTNTSFSISAWVKPTKNFPSSCSSSFVWNVCDYGLVIRPGFHMGLTYQSNGSGGDPTIGFFRAGFYDSTNTGHTLDSSVMGINQWHYLTEVVDDTAKTGSFYVDGTLTATTSYTGSLMIYGTTPYNIGVSNPGDVTFEEESNSQIDEVRIYNYARTLKQVVQDMNAGHPAGGSPVGSMLGYWKFEEGYGTTAHNSGNGGATYDGTLQNMSSPATVTSGWQQAGKFGKALEFDGINDDVQITGLMGSPASVTLSAWVNLASVGSSGSEVISLGDDVTLRVDNTGGNGLTGVYYKGGGVWNEMDSHQFIAGTGWHHLVYTVDPVNSKEVLYEDGNVIASGTTSDAIVYSGNGSNTFIGKHGNGNTNYFFAGLIDEAKVYNYALTADEVKIDYNHGSSQAFGSLGTNTSDGKTASNSAGAAYCIPGDTSTCGAPVGEWNFDEGVGATVNDTSGNGDTGTWHGSNTHWTQGKIGRAGNFSAPGNSSDYVDLGSPTTLENLTGPFTTSAWVKMTGKNCATYFDVIFAAQSASWGFSLQSSGGGNCKVDMWLNGSDNFGATELVLNKWYYVTAVFIPSTSLTYYVNGQLDAQFTSSIPSTQTTSGNFGIGILQGNSNNFVGQIDQVRVYNYARTAAQVAWDYNRGGPVGWWKFDECQGSVAHDSSVNRNDGTITIGAGGSQTGVGTCTDGLSTSAWNNGAVGKYNASLNLDGTDDYIDAGTNSVLAPQNNDYTASLWVKASSLSCNSTSGCGLLSTAATIPSGGLQGYTLFYSGSLSKLRLEYADGTTNIDTGGITGTTLSTGTWYHIVLIFSRTAGKVYIYINGNLVFTRGTFGVANAITNNHFLIGSRDAGTSNTWNGQIDEVKVFNYALTVNQINNLYNQGASVRFGPLTGTP